MRLIPASLVPLFLVASLFVHHKADDKLPAGVTARLGDGSDPVRAVAVAPDGAAVAVARGPVIGLFRITGTELRSLNGHGQPVLHLAYAPHDKLLVSAADRGDDGPLRLWDPTSGELLRRWGDANRTVRDFAFSEDGQTLAILEPDAITLHQPRTGRFAGSLPLPDGLSELHRLALSPDGRTLAAGCERERVVWDLPTRRLVRCSPTAGPCRGLCFLASSRRLIWLDPNDLRLWPLLADDASTFLPGRYLRDVTALALAPDSRRLAVAQGREITLWDVAAPQLLRRLDGHRAPVRALAFTPDGHALIAGDDAGTALVWDVKQ